MQTPDVPRALLSERRQLDEIFRLSPSCMVILTGPDHVFERANERYLELIGQRAVVGRRVRDVLPELVEQGFVELLDRVYRTGEPYVGRDVPIMFRRPGSAPQTHYFDFVYQPMRDAQGRITGIFGQAVDLTERRRAEARLRSTRERFDLLAGNIRDYAMVITDAEGRITEWEGGAERITGHRADDVVGQPIDLLFTAEDRAADVPGQERALARMQGRAEDRRWHRRADGSRFFANGVAVPLFDAGGALHGYGKVFRDETARHREAEQRALLLQVAHRMLETRGDIATLAREVFDLIRGPLGLDLFATTELDEAGSLRIVAQSGFADATTAAETPLRGCCSWVAGRSEAVVARGAAGLPDPVAGTVAALGVRAYACHPLLGADGRVLGTFAAGGTARAPFEADEVHFLQTVAHFLALAQARSASDRALAAVTEASEQRRRLYETVLSNTPDFVYVFDRQHRFAYANDVLLRLWGRTWDEAIGRTCLELGYEPWHAAMHDREIEQVIATKQPIRGEVPFEGTFGHRIYDYIFVPVIGPDGEVEAVAGTTRDVTERKRSEDDLAALAAREQRRADLMTRLAHAGSAMARGLSVERVATILAEQARALIGAHQAVASLTVSPEWAQAINGISLSEKYAAWRSYSTPSTGEGIYSEVCRTNRAMRLTQAELEVHPLWRGFGAHAKDHPSMRGWLAVPLVGQGGRNLGVVQLSDKYEGEFDEQDEAILTQLAAIGAVALENARLYEQVRDQDRRKDEFLATLAHELRNPLAPIRSGLDVLRRATSPESAAQVQAVMARQVGHMVRLIDDLLDVSRITSGKIELRRERVAVADVLDAALEVSRPLLEVGGHKLEVEAPPPDLAFDVDATRIAQVVSNLLNNAAKYTPDGGRIALSARAEDADVVIRVTDSGVGLAPESLPQVFELFSQVGRTLDRAQGGLGIGLALVRRLVELHGGRVAVASDGPGRGCRFEVRLPRAPAPAATTASVPVTPVSPGVPAAAPAGPRRVLVVDDNVDAARTLAMLLELQGDRADVVHQGGEALARARGAAYDVVLLDIDLPDLDGLQVAEALRADGIAARLIALTGLGSAADRARTEAAGFDRHLTKPVEAGALLAVLDELAREAGPVAR